MTNFQPTPTQDWCYAIIQLMINRWKFQRSSFSVFYLRKWNAGKFIAAHPLFDLTNLIAANRYEYFFFASLECPLICPFPLSAHVTWYLSNQHFVLIWQLNMKERRKNHKFHKLSGNKFVRELHKKRKKNWKWFVTWVFNWFTFSLN
jgi:hypothetical protein